MKPPCEMVVWYVIPAIRSELAKDLLKLGMKQKTISELMDITQPAVSQYLTDKRGSGIEFNDDVKQLIQDFADDLNDGTATKADIEVMGRGAGDIALNTAIALGASAVVVPEFPHDDNNICKRIKTEDILCQIHREHGHVPADCKACLGSALEL